MRYLWLVLALAACEDEDEASEEKRTFSLTFGFPLMYEIVGTFEPLSVVKWSLYSGQACNATPVFVDVDIAFSFDLHLSTVGIAEFAPGSGFLVGNQTHFVVPSMFYNTTGDFIEYDLPVFFVNDNPVAVDGSDELLTDGSSTFLRDSGAVYRRIPNVDC